MDGLVEKNLVESTSFCIHNFLLLNFFSGSVDNFIILEYYILNQILMLYFMTWLCQWKKLHVFLIYVIRAMRFAYVWCYLFIHVNKLKTKHIDIADCGCLFFYYRIVLVWRNTYTFIFSTQYTCFYYNITQKKFKWRNIKL